MGTFSFILKLTASGVVYTLLTLALTPRAEAELLEALYMYSDDSVYFSVTADSNNSNPKVVFDFYLPFSTLQLRKRHVKRLIETLNETYDSDDFNQLALVRELQKQLNIRFEFRRDGEVIAVCKAPNRYIEIGPDWDEDGNDIWSLETTVQVPIENPRPFEREICWDSKSHLPIVPILQDGDTVLLLQKKSSILGDEEEIFECWESFCDDAFD